jgi:hypothetical protein
MMSKLKVLKARGVPTQQKKSLDLSPQREFKLN